MEEINSFIKTHQIKLIQRKFTGYHTEFLKYQRSMTFSNYSFLLQYKTRQAYFNYGAINRIPSLEETLDGWRASALLVDISDEVFWKWLNEMGHDYKNPEICDKYYNDYCGCVEARNRLRLWLGNTAYQKLIGWHST